MAEHAGELMAERGGGDVAEHAGENEAEQAEELGGMWILTSGEQELDRVWKDIQQIQFQIVKIPAEPSAFGKIQVLTSDCRNHAEVRSAAVAITEAAPYYRSDLKYKRAKDVKDLYIFKCKNQELLILDTFDTGDIFYKPGGTFYDIPTRVTKTNWLIRGPYQNPIGSGKWLLFFDKRYRSENGGYTELDKFWLQMIDRFPAGSVIKMMCSTGHLKNAIGFEDKGCIGFFTMNQDDPTDAEAAARMIREALPSYDEPIFYKREEDWFGEGKPLYKFTDNELEDLQPNE